MSYKCQEKDKGVRALYKRLLREAAGSASIVCVAAMIVLAAVIIFVVSLADKETREAYEKVNTVPVENSVVMGKD